MSATRSSNFLPILISVFAGVFCLLITLFFLYASGETNGLEFSPDDFTRRRFSYNRTPYLNWVLKGESFDDRTTTLEDSLTLDGFIPTRISTTKIWHLVSDSGSSADFPSDQCDARFLTRYLDLSNNEGEYIWTLWNEDHPKCAKVFWPHVANLARNEMYLKVPDIMRFAMQLKKDNVVSFTKELEEILAAAYLELGTLDLDTVNWERAASRLQQSYDLNPTEAAKQKLERCKTEISLLPADPSVSTEVSGDRLEDESNATADPDSELATENEDLE
jgi:hypothetical protein